MTKEKVSSQRADLDQIERQYSELAHALQSTATALANQIEQLLDGTEVRFGFPIQQRIKTWSSLSDKLIRLPHIADFEAIQDLIGLRIILLFRRDVEVVCNLLEKNYSISRQYDTQDRLHDDQFGYLSKHYVIEVDKSLLRSLDVKSPTGLFAEVQIRTVAQHIWSEVSHKLQYKQEHAIPPSVRRSIYRVSALLETVDLEFERVLEERQQYRASIPVKGAKDDEQLNVDLLENVLDSILPTINKAPFENYDLLLSGCKRLGINTRINLIELLNKHLKMILLSDSQKAQDVLMRFANDKPKSKPHTSKYQLERAANNVFFSHTGLLREALIVEFGEEAKTHFPESSL